MVRLTRSSCWRRRNAPACTACATSTCGAPRSTTSTSCSGCPTSSPSRSASTGSPPAGLRAVPKLVDLHLRKNDIADLDEVRSSSAWTACEPCGCAITRVRWSKLPYARHRHASSLLVLDGDEVTPDERRAAETMPDVFLPSSGAARSSPGAARSSPEPSPGSTRGDHDDARSERTVNADRAVRDANARSYELAASRQLAGLGPIGDTTCRRNERRTCPSETRGRGGGGEVRGGDEPAAGGGTLRGTRQRDRLRGGLSRVGETRTTCCARRWWRCSGSWTGRG